ncbi:MAG: DUF4249 family protein [Saprospiraceae bacterium]|nr:DUF4249 family protein [Saprospiraceae bacterium]
MIQWERQEFCLFCYANQRVLNCFEDLYGTNRGLVLVRNNRCAGDCFDIFRQNPNNTIADAFFDGKQLIKKSVAEIAYNFPYGTLIEVRQSSITPSYFDFTELLKSQSQNTGGLIDVPPALLQGNVRNLNNPAETVIGFFSVTNTSTRRLWVNRSAAATVPLSSLSSLLPPVPTPVPPPPRMESASVRGKPQSNG